MSTFEIEILSKQTLEKTREVQLLYDERKSSIEALLSSQTNYIKALQTLCSNRIDLVFNNFIYKAFNNLKLKYKYCNVPFNAIYPTKPKTILNGSDSNTKTHLYNAMKYQALANWNELESLSEIEIKKVICFYGFKLLNNVNNNCTYNTDNNIIYDPIAPKKISEFAINIYEDIYNRQNYSVIDLHNQEKKLKYKFEYMKEKRFTKEGLEKLINSFDCKPTIKQLVEKFNELVRSKIEESTTDDEKISLMKSLTSPELMRKYIKMYELETMLNINNYKN